MKIIFYGDKLVVTKAMKEYAEKKFKRFDEMLPEVILVKFSYEKNSKISTFFCQVGIATFRRSSEDMYQAIDEVSSIVKNYLINQKRLILKKKNK